MKPKNMILIAILTGLALAGPGRPGFASAPEWLDTNENGQIDQEEVQAWADLRAKAAKGLADRADADGDGTVDSEERQAAIERVQARITERRCELFDNANGTDDVLTVDEFSAIGPVSNMAEQAVARLFGLLDLDGNGEVTKEEFLESIGGGPPPKN